METRIMNSNKFEHDKYDLTRFEKIGFCDKLQIWFRKKLKRFNPHTLRTMCGNKPHEDITPMKFHPSWQFKIVITQPTRQAIEYLMSFRVEHMINDIEIAVDYCHESSDKIENLRRYIDSHLVVKRAPRLPKDIKQSTYFKNTLYIVVNNNIKFVAYSDRPSKINNLPCCHVEFRLKSKPVLSAHGINHLSDVIDFDVRSFLEKHLDFVEYPNPRFIGRVLMSIGCIHSSYATAPKRYFHRYIKSLNGTNYKAIADELSLKFRTTQNSDLAKRYLLPINMTPFLPDVWVPSSKEPGFYLNDNKHTTYTKKHKSLNRRKILVDDYDSDN